MSIILITGSSGLVGSESVNFFSKKGFDVVGIDNDLRKVFFGNEASTNKIKKNLIRNNKRFKNYNTDIRNYNGLEKIYKKFKKNITDIVKDIYKWMFVNKKKLKKFL